MKVAMDVVRARRERVANLLRQQRYLPLTDLCTRFGISEATARRDLAALARDQKIQRTYGGALGDFNQRFASVDERSRQAPEAKKRIAAAAVRLIRPRQVCYLDAGTTMDAIAQVLIMAPIKSLTLVTNNLRAAERLSTITDSRVHLLGGQLLPRQSVLLGDQARATLAYWKFDLAFLSAESFNAQGIWNSQSDVVRFQIEVLRQARQSFFCLDRTKLNQTAPYRLVTWKSTPHLITDATPQELRAAHIGLTKPRVTFV